MSDTNPGPDRRAVFAVSEEEKAAVEAGDIDRYLALLSGDAVFMPQNDTAKSGAELHQWLRDFLARVTIRYDEFAHGETVIRNGLACHAYTCRWTATPRTGGRPVSASFKGMHVLRKQTDGAWKISRSIWNTDPA